LSVFIKLERVRRDTGLETGERPERHLGAVPAVPRARIGLDVPIETKLHAPDARAEWVERPRLTGYLTDTTARLVLVDAPAGFGKTTLVAQWRSSPAERRPFAWVSLDRADDDPSRLWWYITGALQRACPEFNGEVILNELRVPAPNVTGMVLPLLANELAALSVPVVLVLDDYHVIKERSCQDQVAFLLLHLPPSAQIVLITRADPPLPLARMRASGEMVEIRARELRFGPDDAAALVHLVSGARLSEADLADLVERTEGWPAGVYLAALSLRGHPSPHDFVREFTGDNRFIVDFLADEVLSRQPGDVQQFMARTSILTRFCAALCDAVTGSANAVEIIEVLERENLFLVPLDDNRQWYRYHHLFAQLLRSKLVLTEPGIMRTLHQRASTWHQQSGSTEEAVSHSLAADDIDTAVDLITRHWLAYVTIGRTATVRRWMRLLGDDRIAANPVAAHCAAWAAALTGDRETVRRWLPVVESGHHDGPLPDQVHSLRSSVAMLRGVFGFDGLVVMRESAVMAVELERDPATPYYALARAALGYSLCLSGEPAAAAVPLEEAVQSRAGLPIIAMYTLAGAAMVAVELGRLSKAEELAREACALAARSDLAKAPQSSRAHVAMGAVLAARGRLHEARTELERSFEHRGTIGLSPWPDVEASLLLGSVLVDLGDRPGAAELADEARAVLAVLPDGTEALQAKLAELDRRVAGRPRLVSLAESLTDREVAVLRLLGGSLSLREIGQELYVSANTVKTHTQAIYRKLGVSTRHDAVEQGKQMGILCAPAPGSQVTRVNPPRG
jgi:LuxR family transcriptional regulator, maltose regulon positive regulatory protein